MRPLRLLFRVTIACYYATGVTIPQIQFDSINSNCTLGTWAVLQVGSTTDRSHPIFRLHTAPQSNTTYGFQTVPVTVGKVYWVNMQFDGTAGVVNGAVFDPDNGFAQVGSTMQAESAGAEVVTGIAFGQTSAHGNHSNATSQSYFDNILIDYTNAAFPLLPSGYNDSTAPSAPPVVRDGTGADQSIALSTTQLSASGDPAWDAESGIQGYQYAIATSQGGTNVVNWTSLPNQTIVTKTGLSLTTGQTYYFSVKAVNGVGLVSSATNSNGRPWEATQHRPGVIGRAGRRYPLGLSHSGYRRNHFDHGVGRELRPGLRSGERNQLLSVRHRHLALCNEHGQLDEYSSQFAYGVHQADQFDPDARAKVLLQREGRQ